MRLTKMFSIGVIKIKVDIWGGGYYNKNVVVNWWDEWCTDDDVRVGVIGHGELLRAFSFQVIAPTRSNYWRKMRKITIYRPFFFFSAIIELVQELLISNIHNKFEENMWKTFQVIAPTGSNYWRKMRKIAINRPFFFSAIIELLQELLISNMHNQFEEDMWKTFQVFAPTRSNYWRNMWKIAINRPFFFFCHYWTCPRTTY